MVSKSCWVCAIIRELPSELLSTIDVRKPITQAAKARRLALSAIPTHGLYDLSPTSGRMVNFGTLAVGSDDGTLTRPLPRICPHSRTDLPVNSQFFLGLTSEASQSFNKMSGCDSERTETKLDVT